MWSNQASALVSLVSWLFASKILPETPMSCLAASRTLEQLVSCLDTFTVPHNYYNHVTYELAQPNALQREAWVETVSLLLSVDGNCSTVVLPDALQGLYTVAVFQEDFNSYCVLVEHSLGCGFKYYKGWGFMVVPSTRSAISRSIHLSAPHPKYDLGTVEQAATLFKSTGAHSLLVAGRIRTAFLQSSDCVVPSGKGQYYKTDPAHNNLEPFVDASLAIHAWQSAHGGCPSSTCAYIQIHGKGTRLIRIVGNSTSSQEWYTSPVDHPIKRLKTELQLAFPMWNVSLPSDSPCILTATKNVIGRYVNGVPLSDVCTTSARSRSAKGEFVHIEQASVSRNAGSYDAWGRALRETFETSCVKGMQADPKTQMSLIAVTIPVFLSAYPVTCSISV
ncbi:hypothetical protein BDQ12DRAFT_753373 [Crucibulum laeve]|uniref:Secreted protein n=1 Tax=Crucibulum laeve TaxID=68775 RepID=A0A5C3LYW1_9AGAR|nr:hypothetical protein BDQ12DRAFT_753373 [Crucibulum laeve]